MTLFFDILLFLIKRSNAYFKDIASNLFLICYSLKFLNLRPLMKAFEFLWIMIRHLSLISAYFLFQNLYKVFKACMI